MGYTKGHICQNLWDIFDRNLGIYWVKLWDILCYINGNIFK